MSDNLKDILSNSPQGPGGNKDLDNQKLMDYLNNHLSQEQQHEVEKAMNDDIFINDAVEGLQQIGSRQNIEAYTDQLNSFLQKQTEKNKSRKDKRRWKDSPYTYLTIVIVLLLLVICYVTLRKFLN